MPCRRSEPPSLAAAAAPSRHRLPPPPLTTAAAACLQCAQHQWPCASCDSEGLCTDCTGGTNCSDPGHSVVNGEHAAAHGTLRTTCGYVLENGTCQPCPPLCRVCTSPTNCSLCYEQLVEAWGPKQGIAIVRDVFPDGQGGCRTCQDACTNCNAGVCQQCGGGTYLQDGNCTRWAC